MFRLKMILRLLQMSSFNGKMSALNEINQLISTISQQPKPEWLTPAVITVCNFFCSNRVVIYLCTNIQHCIRIVSFWKSRTRQRWIHTIVRIVTAHTCTLVELTVQPLVTHQHFVYSFDETNITIFSTEKHVLAHLIGRSVISPNKTTKFMLYWSCSKKFNVANFVVHNI